VASQQHTCRGLGSSVGMHVPMPSCRKTEKFWRVRKK
jgi:hypothetical protein